MENENAYKIKLIKIIEILRWNSDEDNYISTNEILNKLREIGIKCERRTLYRDIAVLNDFGYEVQCIKQIGKENMYCIVDRVFSVPELKIMIDSVQSASFITEKKTTELVNKIADLGGSHRAELFKNSITKYNSTKHSNEQIFYAVGQIEEAIRNHKQLSFFYFDYNSKMEKVYRKKKERYFVNPYSMILSYDNYYLVVYSEKYNSMIHYRIDRMTNVDIEETDCCEPDWINNFSITKHKKEVFGMYVGKEVVIIIEFETSLIDVVVDKFGENESYTDLKNGKISLTQEVQISPQFISWVCSFGNKMKVVYPQDVIESIKEYIKEMQICYEI